MSQSELARRCGVSQPSVSAWIRFTARPEAHLRPVIRRVLGVAGLEDADWFTDEERAIANGTASGPKLPEENTASATGTDS